MRAILTKGGAEFVTPLSLSVLCEEKAFTDLFDLKDEAEIGHIRFAREADLIVVAPATADLMAKMAHGLADDLATAVLLAADKTVLVAPAMNVRMWQHPATRRNVARLRDDGIAFVGPNEGEMACGEYGEGRMAEPGEIVEAIERLLAAKSKGALSGPPGADHLRARPMSRSIPCATSPTAHRASRAMPWRVPRPRSGAEVTLVTGPVGLPDPEGVTVIKVETAREMLDAALAALPADIAICAAAVADWRAAAEAAQKLKKEGSVERDLAPAHPEPGYPRDPRRAGAEAPAPRHRLCCRDRERRHERHGEAPRQGRRLDRRQ